MRLLHSLPVPTLLLALAAQTAADSISATPHDSYSSSVGVLGCKINTDRVAYWPGSVDCDNICVKLSHGGRSVHLLRIDQSGGAHDISYDAWVYLQTGKSAAEDPITGGGVDMEYEEVDASECADLIHTDGAKLPLSASNSINFLTSCLAQPDSYVAKNFVLYNICDAICSLGYNEECELDLDVSNQPSCPHTLGLTTKLTTTPVYNVEYQSGTTVEASTGEVVSADVAAAENDDDDSDDSADSAEQTTSEDAQTTTAPATTTTTPTVVVESTSSSDAPAEVHSTAAPVAAVAETTSTTVPPTTLSTVTSPAAIQSTSTTTSSTSQEPSHSPGVFVVTSETVISQAAASSAASTESATAAQSTEAPNSSATTTFSRATVSSSQSTTSSSPSGSAAANTSGSSVGAAVSGKMALLTGAAACWMLLA
ncbi:Cerato-platanin [Pleurostoma richardsiae]|uniref:Cerato-platanin n=1 Tax=Pleurostoma richardsiae TaxID=41990 RepID=A0AA38VQI3_9PEZI|nr:Cerato-platanin [Pleurostoma richardsiae]